MSLQGLPQRPVLVCVLPPSHKSVPAHVRVKNYSVMDTCEVKAATRLHELLLPPPLSL